MIEPQRLKQDTPESAVPLNATFTPGPWALELRQAWPFGVRITAANGDTILQVGACAHSTVQKTRQECEDGVGFRHKSKDGSTTRDAVIFAIAEQDANARLIAAAPTMHFLLKRLIDELPTRRDWLDPDLERMARDILATVEGDARG